MPLGVLGDPFIGRFATRPWDWLEIEHCISAAQEAASRGALESLLKCNSLTAFEEAGFPVDGVLVGESLEPWISVRMWFEERAECEASGEPFTLGPLQPIEHYEVRYRRFRDAAAVDELMARSDPVAVAAYDALADEFNARLNEICASGLVEEVMEYVRRVKEIIYSESKLTELERADFAHGVRLTRSSFAPWESVRMWLEERAECEAFGGSFTLGLLQPMEHYEARCLRLRGPEAAAELMARSHPAAVVAHNALVDEFNARLNEICGSGLVEEAMKYVGRAKEIVC